MKVLINEENNQRDGNSLIQKLYEDGVLVREYSSICSYGKRLINIESPESGQIHTKTETIFSGEPIPEDGIEIVVSYCYNGMNSNRYVTCDEALLYSHPKWVGDLCRDAISEELSRE